MQNNNRHARIFEFSQLTKSLALLTTLLAFWIFPASHKICAYLDFKTFDILNHSLIYSRTWQLLWGYLNHPNETWLNIIFMIAVNVIAIFAIPKEQRLRATVLFVYCWLSFQLVLGLTHVVFCDWLQIDRFSPSIAIRPWIVLSESLNIPNIKVYSHSSFPAGHILVLVYWLQFLRMYCNARIYGVALFSVLLLTLPRMISGAHWLSDIIFTIVYGNIWFYILSYQPLLQGLINSVTTLLRKNVANPVPQTNQFGFSSANDNEYRI